MPPPPPLCAWFTFGPPADSAWRLSCVCPYRIGYIFRGATRRCEVCEGAKANSLIIVVIMMAVGGLAALVFLGGVDLGCLTNNYFIDFAKNIDSGSLKVAWVTYQIIASTSFNLNIAVSATVLSN